MKFASKSDSSQTTLLKQSILTPQVDWVCSDDNLIAVHQLRSSQVVYIQQCTGALAICVGNTDGLHQWTGS